MQKDNAHLNLDEDGLGNGVITPADDSLVSDLTGLDTNGMEDSMHDITEKLGKLKVGEEGTDAEDLDD
ncbi:hypothetical protein PMIN04_011562 [Paraphaeosphaeria minitans]